MIAEVAALQRGAAVLAALPRPPVGLTPSTVVHRHDKLCLRWYGGSGRTPVVLVPSLINKAWILDLEPDRSLVAALVAAGHPTYLVDWGDPGPEDAGEDVAYVLHELLHRAIDRACRHARASQAIVFGYCMGGTLAATLAALRPQRFAALALLAAPVKFSEGGRFRDLVAPIDLERTLDPQGLMPADAMRPVFQLLDPVGAVTKHAAIDAAAADPVRLRRVLARERWLEENVSMPGAFALEFAKATYQEDRLFHGTWSIQGERVDLGRVPCPTLVMACKKDFIAPEGAVLPAMDLIPGARLQWLETGHIGAVVGEYGPKVLYPLLDRWFREVVP